MPNPALGDPVLKVLHIWWVDWPLLVVAVHVNIRVDVDLYCRVLLGDN